MEPDLEKDREDIEGDGTERRGSDWPVTVVLMSIDLQHFSQVITLGSLKTRCSGYPHLLRDAVTGSDTQPMMEPGFELRPG